MLFFVGLHGFLSFVEGLYILLDWRRRAYQRMPSVNGVAGGGIEERDPDGEPVAGPSRTEPLNDQRIHMQRNIPA